MTNKEAIASAQNERDIIYEECFQLLYQISRKSSSIKLLKLARNHLKILVAYKQNRAER